MTTPGAPAAPPAPREYLAEARSTDVFGRVLDTIRDHHFIVDGPVLKGCPGVEVTPAELFLAAVASCGVELVQVIAKEDGVAVSRVHARIKGIVDRSRQSRPDVTLFNRVEVGFTLGGVNESQAAALVEKFKKR
jgi:uncharacterized OsmC-like protein